MNCYILLCILLISFVLWRYSHLFRYCVRFIYFDIVVALFTGVCIIPIAIWKPRSVDNLRPVSWVWTKLFVDLPVLGLEYEIKGADRLVSDKPCVIVSNHQSSLDVVGLLKFLPERCSFLAKKSLLYAGSFGIGALLCGIVFVDRSNARKAKQTLKDAIERIHKENIKLWVFPEGTRRMGKELLPFKKGAFNIAVEAQIPIVPVVFSSYKNFYDKKRKILEPGKIVIQCLPPIPTEGLTLQDVPDLADKVRTQMNQVFLDISKDLPIGHQFASVTANLKTE